MYLAQKNIMLRSASYTDFFVLEDKIIQYIKLSSDKIRTSDWLVGVDVTKSNIPEDLNFLFSQKQIGKHALYMRCKAFHCSYSNLDLSFSIYMSTTLKHEECFVLCNDLYSN